MFHIKPVVLALVASLAVTAPALASPKITSFYAKDEGANIVLRVNFCVTAHEIGNGVIATFRMWDETTGALVYQQRVSARARWRCMIASVRLVDVYPAGGYSANVAVTNRTTHEFRRIAARYFGIY